MRARLGTAAHFCEVVGDSASKRMRLTRPSPTLSMKAKARRRCCAASCLRKVDVRLPGKGNSNSRGARPVHPIITMIKWTQTIRLSIKNSHSSGGGPGGRGAPSLGGNRRGRSPGGATHTFRRWNHIQYTIYGIWYIYGSGSMVYGIYIYIYIWVGMYGISITFGP